MMMANEQIYTNALTIVSDVMSIPTDMICSQRRYAELVDARYMIAYILSYNGLYTSEIARIMHVTEKHARHMCNSLRDRLRSNHYFAVRFNKVKTKLTPN